MDNRVIRAEYDDDTITIYQAYRKEIAIPAVKNQTFIFPFKLSRMTWIKPSFLWMMYRSGWGQKEGQECILKIKIKRSGFEWALKNSCLSHFDKNIYNSIEEWKVIKDKSPVRIQWDPERDLYLNPLNYRTIQIGLSGIAVEKYVKEWIVSIEDISTFLILYKEKLIDLPKEKIYFLEDNINKIIGVN